MAAPVVPIDPNPDALAVLAVVPPAVPPAPATPPAPVAVDGGEQAAPALQAEVCSFEFSSAVFLVLVGQGFYRHFNVWSRVRPWFFCWL